MGKNLHKVKNLVFFRVYLWDQRYENTIFKTIARTSPVFVF